MITKFEVRVIAKSCSGLRTKTSAFGFRNRILAKAPAAAPPTGSKTSIFLLPVIREITLAAPAPMQHQLIFVQCLIPLVIVSVLVIVRELAKICCRCPEGNTNSLATKRTPC